MGGGRWTVACAALALAGCFTTTSTVPPDLRAAPAEQVDRIMAVKLALVALERADSPDAADRAIGGFRAAVAALDAEGEVRRLVADLDRVGNLLAQVALEPAGTPAPPLHGDYVPPGRTLVSAGGQATYLRAYDRLLRVEVDTLVDEAVWAELSATFKPLPSGGPPAESYLRVVAIRVAPVALEAAGAKLADPDWRVAVAARMDVPPDYLATPAMRAFVAERVRAAAARDGSAAARRLVAALPLAFPPEVASPEGRAAAAALREFQSAHPVVPDVLIARLTDALAVPVLPIAERVALLAPLVADEQTAVTALWPRPVGAGAVLRRLAIHPEARVRASVALAVPKRSEVLDAVRLVSRRLPDDAERPLLGTRPLRDPGALRACLRVALADDDPLVRLLAADAWEGNGEPRLDGFDPRDDDATRAAALAALDARLAAPRPEAEPRDPGAPADAPAPRRLDAEQIAAVEQSLAALGWMHEVWVRPNEMGREPDSLRELRTTPPFDQHGIGDVRVTAEGTLRHAKSGYVFRLAARPDGGALTIWADPPAGVVDAPTLWFDRTGGVVRRRD